MVKKQKQNLEEIRKAVGNEGSELFVLRVLGPNPDRRYVFPRSSKAGENQV